MPRKPEPRTVADLPNIQAETTQYCVARVLLHGGYEKTFRLFKECGERLLCEFNEQELDVFEIVHSLGGASIRSDAVMCVEVDWMVGAA